MRSRRAWICGVALTLVAVGFAPSSPAQVANEPDVSAPAPAPGAPPASVPATEPPEPVVLLPALRGIRFLSDEAGLVEALPTLDDPLDRTRVPVLDHPEFELAMQAHLGQAVTEASLDGLQRQVQVFLAAQGLPFSVVYLPPQDITGGFLQVVVTTSVTDDEVAVEGARHFDAGNYLRWVRQRPGVPPDIAAFKQDIAWISRNPYRVAEPRIRPGTQPGTTQLMMAVRDRTPWRVYTAFSNTGTRATDRERWAAGFNWGNAFGRDHELSVNLAGSVDVHRSRSIALSYLVPLPWRHLLHLDWSLSESAGKVPAGLDQEGGGRQLGLKYEVPLGGVASGHSLSAGVEFKRSDNLLLLNLGAENIPLVDGSTEVYQLRLGYDGRAVHTAKGATTDFGVSAVYSPGGLSDRNEDRAFANSRAFAAADYEYVTARARHVRPFWRNRWEYSLRGNLQWTEDTLIGIEQMVVGGMSTVRGYEENEAFGDRGIVLGQELAFPAVRLAGLGRDELRPFAFHEGGWTESVRRLPGEHSMALHAVGLGLRYRYGQNVSLNVAGGWPLRRAESGADTDAKAHLSLQLGF